ncbi:MAG: ribonuclease H-like domain-containing protein [Alphaproteobacteria bacterium]|nr:ribonuclease H-like domain-containing protein [Alphaproteobacteria bacterium]
MTIHLHKGDLPANVTFKDAVAVDTETLGLKTSRDKLCLIQLSAGDGTAHIVQFDRKTYDAPNLKKLLSDNSVLKIFHYARFDIAMLKNYLQIDCAPLWCTKIASKLARTYTDKHGLKELCRELIGIEISKQQQVSDWGAEELSQAQLTYAATDVLHLHKIKAQLENMLRRENRADMAEACFDFIIARAEMDLAGWEDIDIFSHK